MCISYFSECTIRIYQIKARLVSYAYLFNVHFRIMISPFCILYIIHCMYTSISRTLLENCSRTTCTLKKTLSIVFCVLKLSMQTYYNKWILLQIMFPSFFCSIRQSLWCCTSSYCLFCYSQ